MSEDCGVCLDQDCGESAVVWLETVVRARTSWACYECRDAISIGAEYQKIRMLYDGRWSTVRTCLACVEVHRALSSCDREDGSAGYRVTGALWDDIECAVFPEMTRACIEKCQTAAARAKLVQRWNDWKF